MVWRKEGKSNAAGTPDVLAIPVVIAITKQPQH